MKKTLYQTLSNCSNEEEVKFYFVSHFKHFGFRFDTRKNIDFYTPQTLFEFKFDGNFRNVCRLARTFAQALYYIRRLKYGNDLRVPSQNVCVVDKQSAAILPTDAFNCYIDRKANFDWDLAPSTPCKKLIAALAEEPFMKDCHVFEFDAEEKAFDKVLRNIFLKRSERGGVSKVIDENNFYAVFEQWNKQFGAVVANSHKPSEYFLTDIENGKSAPAEPGIITGKSLVRFRLHDGTVQEKLMPIDSYKTFWDSYEKVKDARTMLAIRQRMDRMTTIELRRFTGEFFTPIEHARKALEYLARVIGDRWWESGEYRLWDMAAGTGNLEFPLPNEALKYCYISTLLPDDAAYCKKIYPEATAFQYDYLNDGEEKLPPKLRADLDNPELKWIVFINPPYAMASNFERDFDKVHKFNVSMTAIRRRMTDEGMGKASRELSSQFLYRIDRELRDRQTIVGIFSKIKYINATIDQRLREQFFDYKFEGGFVFPSTHFQGTKGKFPVGFAMWNLAEHIPLTDQSIKFDVFNDRLEKIATKTITSAPGGALLNTWIARSPNTKTFPPFSNALSRSSNVKDVQDRVADGFLASLMCNGNDLMHQNYTSLLSGPYISAGGMSVVPENFERAMIVHAVRRLPKANWLNDKDQFLQPSVEPPREFVNDCVVWSLFSGSNCTAAIKDVEYEGEVYQIKNNFYPWRLEEILDWKCAEPVLLYSAVKDTARSYHTKNFFALLYLNEKTRQVRCVLCFAINVRKRRGQGLHGQRRVRQECRRCR